MAMAPISRMDGRKDACRPTAQDGDPVFIGSLRMQLYRRSAHGLAVRRRNYFCLATI